MVEGVTQVWRWRHDYFHLWFLHDKSTTEENGNASRWSNWTRGALFSPFHGYEAPYYFVILVLHDDDVIWDMKPDEAYYLYL